MSPNTIILTLGAYFLVLLVISRFTSKKSDSKTFFTANRQSPWYLVAFGMIGASLSGVTFISVPGWVASTSFGYMQMVLGYLLGYAIIALVLLPLYYKLQLISIYRYLENRFGSYAYRTGAFYFLLSRTIGASFRLFLVAGVLQIGVFNALGIPFYIAVLVTILLIWVYTFSGGIKTIVITDTLQTFFMLASAGLTVYLIGSDLDWGFREIYTQISESKYSRMFFWDTNTEQNFFKQFLAGASIAVVMTGLDQDMMQKNLTCRNLKEAQKNVYWFSVTLVFVNLLFLSLGALLYIYVSAKDIPFSGNPDDLFPVIAFEHLGTVGALVFLLGVIAAAYSSADSALTALTTSFCIDFLPFDRYDEREQTRIRKLVHVGFSVLLFIVILIFKAINNESVIAAVFRVATYTYGPLLGLFACGILTRIKIKDRWVPWITLLSVLVTYLINEWDTFLLGGYNFGFELLILNGLLTFTGLLMVRKS
jgi:SSS family transporter